jgi:hypothetical protein
MLGKYFDWARTTSANHLETYPPADPMKLRSYSVQNTDTAANLLAVLDQGIAYKAWTIMQWHNIVTPVVGSTDAAVAVFTAFIDGVVTRVAAGLRVRTVPEVITNGPV